MRNCVIESDKQDVQLDFLFMRFGAWWLWKATRLILETQRRKKITRRTKYNDRMKNQWQNPDCHDSVRFRNISALLQVVDHSYDLLFIGMLL